MKRQQKNIFLSQGDFRIPGSIFLLTFGLYLPYVFFQEFMFRDTALRYAPMADAFCRGDWLYAFHPRIQCLHPLISGCFARLFNCSGCTGTVLSSLGFFALCAFPLYFLLKEVFGRTTALWGTLFLPFASPLVLISVNGLREPHKMLALLLMTWGVLTLFKYRSSWKGYLLTGLGCGLAFVVRNDLLLFAFWVLFTAGVLEFFSLKNLKRSAAALGIVLFFAAAECLVNYSVCGYLIPGNRLHTLFIDLFHRPPTPEALLLYGVLPGIILYFSGTALTGFLLRFRQFRWGLAGVFTLFLIAVIGKAILLSGLVPGKETVKFIHSLFRGSNPVLLIPAAVGVFLCRKSFKENKSQYVLAGSFLLYPLTILAPILFLENKLYVSSRYLLPGTLFLAGWAVFGGSFAGEKLKKYLPPAFYKPFITTAVCLLAGLCLLHAYSDLINEKCRSKEIRRLQTIKEMAALIRSHYQGEAFFQPAVMIHHYRSNQKPRIFFPASGKEMIAVYYAGGSLCLSPENADFTVSVTPPATGKWQKIGKTFSAGKKELTLWQRRR